MKDREPPSAAASLVELKHSLNAMVIAWRGGATALNERLTVLGTPRSTVTGAAGTVFATADDGAPVVVTAVPVLSPAVAVEVTTRLAALEKSLGRRGAPAARGRAIVLCREAPSIEGWRALSLGLGPRDGDVYLHRGRVMQRLQPPPEVADRGSRLPALGEWSITDWVAAGALVLGVLLTVLGIRGMVG